MNLLSWLFFFWLVSSSWVHYSFPPLNLWSEATTRLGWWKLECIRQNWWQAFGKAKVWIFIFFSNFSLKAEHKPRDLYQKVMEGETSILWVWGKELAAPHVNTMQQVELLCIVYFEPQNVLQHGKGGLLSQLVPMLCSGLILSTVHCCWSVGIWSWSLSHSVSLYSAS